MNKLLDITHDKDIAKVVGKVWASPEDIQDYEDQNADPPPLVPLRLNFDDIQHPWNLHLAKAFAQNILSTDPDLEMTPEAIANVFMTRLQTL